MLWAAYGVLGIELRDGTLELRTAAGEVRLRRLRYHGEPRSAHD